MDINEYAKFVLDNIGKARAGNVLNISDKVLGDGRTAKDFVEAMYKAIAEADIGSVDSDKYFKILKIINEANTKINEGFKFNEQMIMDKMIIGIWRVMHEGE